LKTHSLKGRRLVKTWSLQAVGCGMWRRAWLFTQQQR